MDERRYWWGRNPLGFPCPIGTVGLWTKGGIGGAGNPLGFPCPVGTVGQEGLWTQDCICGTMNSHAYVPLELYNRTRRKIEVKD